MPRKRALQSIEKDLDSVKKRIETAQTELNKLKKSEEILLNELKSEQDRIRAENFGEIGETVYRYFGENISPNDFKETMELLMSVKDAKEFIKPEKTETEDFDKTNNAVAGKIKEDMLID